MNLVVFQGKLVDAPILKYGVDGRAVVNFSLAVPRNVKKGVLPNADFFFITAWGHDAENIHKFFTRGDTILVKGRMENNNYETREGVQIRGYTLVVDSWDFGPKKYGKPSR